MVEVRIALDESHGDGERQYVPHVIEHAAGIERGVEASQVLAAKAEAQCTLRVLPQAGLVADRHRHAVDGRREAVSRVAIAIAKRSGGRCVLRGNDRRQTNSR